MKEAPVLRRVVELAEVPLPGRTMREVVSRRTVGSRSVALRAVRVDEPGQGARRHAHVHRHNEEILYVLRGRGRTWVEGEIFPLAEGDVLLIPAGLRHMTVADCPGGVTLLCFFPTSAPEEDTEELPEVVFPCEGGDERCAETSSS
jgi:quercetin dioxygenase-like cupin family protein